MTTSDTISLSPDAFAPTEMYFLLRDSVMPRPIAWVSSISAAGEPNLAPFSFFNVCCPVPPVLGFSCGPRGDDHSVKPAQRKDTYLNIKETGEFVVNITPERLADEMVATAAHVPHGQNEFTIAGLTEGPSTVVRPPRVVGVPVAYECKLYDIVEIGLNVWIMGSVVHVHIAPEVYVGQKAGLNHRIELCDKIETRPYGRLGRTNYIRIRDLESRG